MEKYVLELDRKEAVMLGALVLGQKLYKTSYEPLKGLCNKIDNICKEVNQEREND